MKSGKLNICYGGQCGSEAKGKMAAYLVDKFGIRIVAGSPSPNAGHTVIKDGRKTITHHIPAGVMGGRDLSKMIVVMGPASVINPAILAHEIETLTGAGFKSGNLFIDGRAAIITQDMMRKEQDEMTKIGGTAQGVGEARSARLMRRGIRIDSVMPEYAAADTSLMIGMALNHGSTILYEMGQGFDLCIDHGVDPVYCTSRNCTPMQALADIGVPPKYLGDVYAVIRPYPIRMNNRDESSGPYPSREITWEEVGRRCGAPHDITEYTTTTKLKRRVFEFAWKRIRTMVGVCSPDFLCLQFINYLSWSDYGKTRFDELVHETRVFVNRLEDETRIPVAYLGSVPGHEHMVDRGIDARGD